MTKNDLKSLLGTLDSKDLCQLLTDIKDYISVSPAVDSIKKVFETGHLLEFQMDNGEYILVDKFIKSSIIDNKLRIFFNVFGITDNIQLAIYFNLEDELIFDHSNVSYTFSNSLPTFLIIDNKTNQANLNTTKVTVCKFQRGVYEEKVDDKKVNKITKSKSSSAKVVKQPKTTMKIEPEEEYVPPVKNEVKLMSFFSELREWLAEGKRRIILDISRSYTFEDDYTSSKTHNNFSLVFKTVKIDENNNIIFDDCVGNKGYFVITPNDFNNGVVVWENSRNALNITNEDKTYTLRMSFMEGSSILSINDKSLGQLRAQLNNIISTSEV